MYTTYPYVCIRNSIVHMCLAYYTKYSKSLNTNTIYNHATYNLYEVLYLRVHSSNLMFIDRTPYIITLLNYLSNLKQLSLK